jgi:DHA2 family multidrug resistance protein
MINVQAAMIAYLDDFKLMFWITISAAPLLLLFRYRPHSAPGGEPAAATAD